MNRRSFLAFLGAVVPAASLAKQIEPQKPSILDLPFVRDYEWRREARLVGSITVSGSHTEYVTSSDTRLMGEA